MTTLLEAVSIIEKFEAGSLTRRISAIENVIHGFDKNACENIYPSLNITPPLLDAAFTLKRISGQINVITHAAGILLLLPKILDEDEVVESLSLGAGNTGRPFDLETNKRIAEFKFINWQGGSEAIRQNSLFKDFYLMAEYDTPKEKYLYVIGTKHPLKFLAGGRALESILSRNNKLWGEFQLKYGAQFTRVNDYYQYRKSVVKLVDVSSIMPQFTNNLAAEIVDMRDEIEEENL
jgi:hypothetical protein